MKSEIIANVSAQIVALIVSPYNRVLYLEAVSTSDTGAHALNYAPKLSTKDTSLSWLAIDKSIEQLRHTILIDLSLT